MDKNILGRKHFNFLFKWMTVSVDSSLVLLYSLHGYFSCWWNALYCFYVLRFLHFNIFWELIILTLITGIWVILSHSWQDVPFPYAFSAVSQWLVVVLPAEYYSDAKSPLLFVTLLPVITPAYRHAITRESLFCLKNIYEEAMDTVNKIGIWKSCISLQMTLR